MLNYQRIQNTSLESPPNQWLLFLHGILGTGNNWRGFARQIVERHPHIGACLVDLRLHGLSQQLPPPHTLEACARDLFAVCEQLPGSLVGISGHSFGGKVALLFASMWTQSQSSTLPLVWILDSTPSDRPDASGSEMVQRVLEHLYSLTFPMVSKQEFVERTQESGFDRGIAQWLAMNLVAREDGYHLRLDLPGIEALLLDYLHQNLWSLVGTLATPCLHFVIGERSSVWSSEDKAYLKEQQSKLDYLQSSILPDSGHWVHMDNPKALLALFFEDMNTLTSNG
jgi:esterase